MTDEVAPLELGQLSVEIASESYLLRSNLPIEVRDSGNRVVGQGQGSMTVGVRPGIYSIRATLPNGQRADELVEVRGPEGLEFRFGSDSDAGTPPPIADALGPQRSLTAYLGTSPGDEPSELVTLSQTRQAIVRELDGGWLFEPRSALVDVPYAVFTTGTRTITTSLPINPVGGFPLDSCIVVPVADDRAARLDVRFVRQRMVASNLEGQLRSGAYADPTSFLDAAVELLYNKYQDPTAAALGGLTLHRLGRLRERVSWVANLARDFDWLADGRILEIALHASDEDAAERARWLAKLIEVARMRPMFADGYALLLDLLRRWPDGTGADLRASALADVTSRIVGVDWSATALIEYRADGT